MVWKTVDLSHPSKGCYPQMELETCKAMLHLQLYLYIQDLLLMILHSHRQIMSRNKNKIHNDPRDHISLFLAIIFQYFMGTLFFVGSAYLWLLTVSIELSAQQEDISAISMAK